VSHESTESIGFALSPQPVDQHNKKQHLTFGPQTPILTQLLALKNLAGRQDTIHNVGPPAIR